MDWFDRFVLNTATVAYGEKLVVGHSDVRFERRISHVAFEALPSENERALAPALHNRDREIKARRFPTSVRMEFELPCHANQEDRKVVPGSTSARRASP